MKKYIISILLTWALAYVFTSFILWDLNPRNWTLEIRQVYTFACICLMFLVPLVSEIIELEKE